MDQIQLAGTWFTVACTLLGIVALFYLVKLLALLLVGLIDLITEERSIIKRNKQRNKHRNKFGLPPLK